MIENGSLREICWELSSISSRKNLKATFKCSSGVFHSFFASFLCEKNTFVSIKWKAIDWGFKICIVVVVDVADAAYLWKQYLSSSMLWQKERRGEKEEEEKIIWNKFRRAMQSAFAALYYLGVHLFSCFLAFPRYRGFECGFYTALLSLF